MPSIEQDRENHQKFLARFELKLPQRQIELLDFAYDMSKYSHRGQVRESGERYFEHCRAATLILVDELGVMDIDMLVGELLHDSVEDSYLLTIPRIRLIYGDEAAKIVDHMTKREGESVEQYAARVVEGGEKTIICKLGDRLHNLRTLKSCPLDKLYRKLEETRVHYVPMLQRLGKYPRIVRLLESRLGEAMDELEYLVTPSGAR